MRALPPVSLSTLLVLCAACDKGTSEPPATAADPEAPTNAPASPPVPRLEGAIEIPAAVPSGAIEIFSVRVPSSMFESLLSADPMRLTTEGMETSEARVQLAKMFDATSAYFNEEHVERSGTAITGAGGELAALASHRCPNNGKLSVESGITPTLSLDCNEGPEGRCIPTVGGKGGPGSYDIKTWPENDVWNQMNFRQEQGHYFHYNFIWKNDASGYGGSQFTTQAFGDLDGDGVFSTYRDEPRQE